MSKIHVIYEHASKLATFLEKFDSDGHYYVVRIQRDGLAIDEKIINFCYQNLFDTPPSPDGVHLGPFPELNDLRSFAYKICEETQCKSVNLISLHDFNEAVIHSSNKDSLRGELDKIGDCLTNVEDQAAVKSFFRKVFQINSDT